MTVIQAALTPPDNDHCTDTTDTTDSTDNTTDNTDNDTNDLSTLPRSISQSSSASSFDITNPQEAFVATISSLIAALNNATDYRINRPAAFINNFNKNLHELIKLFTCVFLKNSNSKGIVDIFEFVVDEQGKVICEHLLTSYINYFISISTSKSRNINNSTSINLEIEVLNSFLILISSNVHFKSHQDRYFHSFLIGKLSFEHLASLFDSLMEMACTFKYKSFGFIGSVPIISDKSRISLQILTCLLLNDTIDTKDNIFEDEPYNPVDKTKCGTIGDNTFSTVDDDVDATKSSAEHTNKITAKTAAFNTNTDCTKKKNNFINVLQTSDDLKSFALFIKFQSQIFQFSYPQNLNLNDLTILTIFSSSMTRISSNYRRFVLSKLDNEELVRFRSDFNVFLSCYLSQILVNQFV